MSAVSEGDLGVAHRAGLVGVVAVAIGDQQLTVGGMGVEVAPVRPAAVGVVHLVEGPGKLVGEALVGCGVTHGVVPAGCSTVVMARRASVVKIDVNVK